MTPSSERLDSTHHVGAVIGGAKGRHHDRPHEKCARRTFAHHHAAVHFQVQPLQRSTEDIKPATVCGVSILSLTFYRASASRNPLPIGSTEDFSKLCMFCDLPDRQ